MTDRRFIPGDTWEPIINIPVGLNPLTGEWMEIEDLVPPDEVDLDELMEITE